MRIMPSIAELWNLDLRHLAALDAIARTRSISRAAEELGYGQSAVSQQLAALERVVGHRLVDRGTGPRPVTLTAAGESLLGHARWILDRLVAARNDLERLDSGEAGSLRIGTFQSAGARLLPSVLAAYRKVWPSITLSIHTETRTGELAELLLAGAIDVAFVEGASIGPGLEHREVVRDRYVALVPPGHRLATRRTVTLADFAGEDFVDGLLGDQCTARGEQALREAGAEGRVVFRTDDNPTRQRLVDAGLGCAVLPGLTVEPGLTNGAVILALEEDIHRTICLAWASERTQTFALLRFVEIAEATLASADAKKPSALQKSGQRRS
jgi:molybdate transport repressor ModE-like protein